MYTFLKFGFVPHKLNTLKRLILCPTFPGLWQSSRRGGVWGFWSVWRLWPIWRLRCWGGWVRIGWWRRRRWWWRRSPVLLLGREHRLHGASHGFLRYRPHHHLLPLHHRLQLPQGMWCLLCFFCSTKFHLCFCVCLQVWCSLSSVPSMLFRSLWLSSRERRSWPENWSLMVFMSLSSLRTMTSRASGTDWCSTPRKSPVTLSDRWMYIQQSIEQAWNFSPTHPDSFQPKPGPHPTSGPEPIFAYWNHFYRWKHDRNQFNKGSPSFNKSAKKKKEKPSRTWKTGDCWTFFITYLT